MSASKESDGNPLSISSMLVSTPRSTRSKEKRKRGTQSGEPSAQLLPSLTSDTSTLTIESTSTSVGARRCVKDCVLSEIIEVADAIPDVKYRLLRPKGMEDESTLEITPSTCCVTQLGPMDVVRLLVSAISGVYQLQVMYPIPRSVEQFKGIATVDPKQIAEILDIIRDTSEYVLCPGLKPDVYEDMIGAAGFHRQGVQVINHPTKRYESTSCLLWHKPANSRTPVGHTLHNVCLPCKKEAHWTSTNAERAILVSEEEKEARRKPTSKYPLNKLSPNSQTVRIERLKKDRQNLQQRLKKLLDSTSLVMDLENSVEISDLVTQVNNNPQHLDDLLKEADKRGHKDVIKAVWEDETHSLARNQFFQDQFRNKPGSKANRWSLITYRIALAIFVRSPAAYEAVKSLKILNLPSRRSLESHSVLKTQPPGVSHHYLCDQWRLYLDHCERQKENEHPVPVAEGILIFDEVKVQNGVCWHTKTNRIVGLCMTHEQLTTLADVYEELEEDQAKKVTYILQFMWRDM